MKLTWLVVSFLPAVLAASAALADHSRALPEPASVPTLITTPLPIEGLTADRAGRLYTTGRTAGPGVACPVWRIDIAAPALVVVGFIPAPSPTGQCGPTGHAFDRAGTLFVSDGDRIFELTPNESSPPTAVVFASGVPGTNGLAFDRDGALWTSDGQTGQGRVWRITPDGTVTEAFRVPPMRNSMALGGALAGDGVGRQARLFPPGTLTNTAGGQGIVANGLAFEPRGTLLIADTARGALWKVRFRRNGALDTPTGCDPTLTANTLCLDAVEVAHPRLEGSDGIALDRAGNVWAAANERNAIAVATEDGVVDVFRNPVDPGTLLRNRGPLEVPTSPVLTRQRFCVANADFGLRDNVPSTEGEIGGVGQPRGKISCFAETLRIPGLPLPVD